jgi:hypothetical protein
VHTIIIFIGSLGVGLVWGWVAGIIASSKTKLIQRIASTFAESILTAIFVYLLTNATATIAFSVATVSTFLVYNAWLSELRRMSKKHQSALEVIL